MKKKFIPALLIALPMMLASCSIPTPSSTPSVPEDPSSEQPSSEVPSEDPSSEVPSEDPSSEVPSSSEGPTGHPYITEPTEIEIWATFNDTYGNVIKAFIEQFKTIEPNITVTYTKKSGS